MAVTLSHYVLTEQSSSCLSSHLVLEYHQAIFQRSFEVLPLFYWATEAIPHFLNPLVVFARFSSWSSWPALGVVPPCWHAVLPGRPSLVLVYAGFCCRHVIVSWARQLGTEDAKKRKSAGLLAVLECNARNSFQPQCVGRQGRCFHCRCSERRRLFKILKFDFSTLFCLRFPRFLRGTLVDEPPVKDWCLPGTVCHQSHPQSSGLASGWQGNIGKPPWHWSRTPGFCTCRILDLGCSQTLQPVLPRWHVHTSAMRIYDVCQGPKESVCLTCLLSTSPQLYFGHLWTIQGFAKLLRLSLWWPLHLRSACVSDLLGLSDSMVSWVILLGIQTSHSSAPVHTGSCLAGKGWEGSRIRESPKCLNIGSCMILSIIVHLQSIHT